MCFYDSMIQLEKKHCLHVKAGYILNCWVVVGNMAMGNKTCTGHEKGFYGSLTDSCVGRIWANRHLLYGPLHNIKALVLCSSKTFMPSSSMLCSKVKQIQPILLGISSCRCFGDSESSIETSKTCMVWHKSTLEKPISCNAPLLVIVLAIWYLNGHLYIKQFSYLYVPLKLVRSSWSMFCSRLCHFMSHYT